MKRTLSTKQTWNLRRTLAIAISAMFIGMLLTLILVVPSLHSGASGSDPVFEHPTISYSYVIWEDASTFYSKNGLTGEVTSSVNDDTLIQSAIDATNSSGGGIVFLKQAGYSATVTVKGSVLLIFEVGVTGVSYSLDSTGIALYYDDGYVIYDAPLNMTGHQIIFGVFHSGSTPPTSPTEGMPFYDTDDHTLYVWNSTHWEDYSGTGAQGPQGPPGLGALGSYTYIIYKNGSNYQARNSTGALLYSSTNASYTIISALEAGTGTVFLRGGTFSCDSTLTLGAKDILEGEGAGITILQKSGGFDPLIKMDGLWSVVKHLRVDGADQTGDGIEMTSNVNGWGFIFDVEVYRCQDGIVINAWGAQVEHCWLRFNNDDGIVIDIASGYYPMIRNSLIKQNTGHGIYQIKNDGYGPSLIDNCMIEFAGTGKWGIYVEHDPIHIVNSECENNAAGDIYIGATSSRSKNSKIITASVGDIKIDYANRTIVRDVTIRSGETVTITANAGDTYIENVLRTDGTNPISDSGENTMLKGWNAP